MDHGDSLSSFRWAVLAAVLLAILMGTTYSVSFAQDDPNLDRPAPTASATSWDAKASDDQAKSFLVWMIHTSGIFGFLIMLAAFVMVFNVMFIGLQLRRENYLPPAFIEQFEQRLQARDYQGAYEAAKGSDSFLGRVLVAGMGRLSRGFNEAEAGMQEAGDDETMSMEHRIGYLSLIASIAPMLGLLGTVQGMVFSLQVIAGANTSPRPSDLADGIATALFTTLEGQVVAIPATIFAAIYRNRLSRFLMECGYMATNLMKDFQHLGKQSTLSTGGGTAATGIPAAPRME